MITTHLAGILVGIMFAAAVVYPATDRRPPVTVVSAEVLTSEIKPGNELLIRYVFDRQTICSGIAERTIYDGGKREIRYESDRRAAFGPVESSEKVIGLVLPESAIPGPARYRLVLSFECNWFQKIFPVTIVEPDLRFTILAKGD